MSLTGKTLGDMNKQAMCITLLNMLMFITNLQSGNQGIEKAIKSGERDMANLSTSLKIADVTN